MGLGKLSRGIDWRGVGFAGLLLFAAAGFDWKEGALAGLILIVVAVCGYRRELLLPALRQPFMLWLLAFALWVVCRAVLRCLQDPGATAVTLEWAGYYLVASAVPALLLALVMESDQRRMLTVLGVALVALLATVLDHWSAAEIADYRAGERAFYGLANAAGLYLSIAILGFFLLPPWGRWVKSGRRSQAILYLGGGILVLAVLLVALRWHQNRTALLAMSVVFPLLTWRYLRWRRVTASGYRPWQVAAAVLTCLVVLMLAFGNDEARQRLASGGETAAMVFSASDEQLPDVAVRHRIMLWRLGWDNVPQRWLAGGGPGFARELISGEPSIGDYPHLHNLYLQLLLEFGLVGLGLYGLAQLTLLRAVLCNSSPGLSGELRLFIAGAMALFLLINLTDVRIVKADILCQLTLLYGLAIAAALGNTGVGPSASPAAREDTPG